MATSRLHRLAIVGPVLMNAGAAGATTVDGRALSAWWGVPFAGVLLSIAVLPLLAPTLWHRHFGKIVFGWIVALVVPFAAVHGPGLVARALVQPQGVASRRGGSPIPG